jgi:stage IV sporulation protein FB
LLPFVEGWYMMDRTKITICLDGNFCFILAFMLLLLPFPWVLSVIFATVVHELCHALTILAFDGNIYALRLGAGGIRMETDPFPPGREIIVAMAGPLGSALLILLARWMPRIAVCGAVHCIYNLLPLFPMDGGRILENLLALCLPAPLGRSVFHATQHILRVFLCLLCLLAVLRWGLFAGALVLLLLWRHRAKRTV